MCVSIMFLRPPLAPCVQQFPTNVLRGPAPAQAFSSAYPNQAPTAPTMQGVGMAATRPPFSNSVLPSSASPSLQQHQGTLAVPTSTIGQAQQMSRAAPRPSQASRDAASSAPSVGGCLIERIPSVPSPLTLTTPSMSAVADPTMPAPVLSSTSSAPSIPSVPSPPPSRPQAAAPKAPKVASSTSRKSPSPPRKAAVNGGVAVRASSEKAGERSVNIWELVHKALKRLGRPKAEAHGLVKTLQECNLTTVEQLTRLDAATCESLQIPLRFRRSICEELRLHKFSKHGQDNEDRCQDHAPAEGKLRPSHGPPAGSSTPLSSFRSTTQVTASRHRLQGEVQGRTARVAAAAVDHIQRYRSAREQKQRESGLRISSHLYQQWDNSWSETSAMPRGRRAVMPMAGIGERIGSPRSFQSERPTFVSSPRATGSPRGYSPRSLAGEILTRCRAGALTLGGAYGIGHSYPLAFVEGDLELRVPRDRGTDNCTSDELPTSQTLVIGVTSEETSKLYEFVRLDNNHIDDEELQADAIFLSSNNLADFQAVEDLQDTSTLDSLQILPTPVEIQPVSGSL